jgi:hypothetical protein
MYLMHVTICDKRINLDSEIFSSFFLFLPLSHSFPYAIINLNKNLFNPRKTKQPGQTFLFNALGTWKSIAFFFGGGGGGGEISCPYDCSIKIKLKVEDSWNSI